MAKPNNGNCKQQQHANTGFVCSNGMVQPRVFKKAQAIMSPILFYLRCCGGSTAKRFSWTIIFLTICLTTMMLSMLTDILPFSRTGLYRDRSMTTAGGFLRALGNTRRHHPDSSSRIELEEDFSDFMKNLNQRVKAESLESGEEMVQRFPGCIIFGVSKCGTKAVIEYLKLHPQVVAPDSEMNFFNNETLQKKKGLEWYIKQMPPSLSHQITVEKSPDYFQNHRCADLIHAAAPSTKLILLLRNPIERLVSEYMQLAEKVPSLPAFEHWVVGKSDSGSIDTKIPSVMVSAYSDHVSYWLSVFPRKQIHIIESQSLREKPLQEMRRVENFLNIKSYFQHEDFYFNKTRGFYCMNNRLTGKKKCLGKSKGREHISVEEPILSELQYFYHPYNKKLKNMLNVNFTWL